MAQIYDVMTTNLLVGSIDFVGNNAVVQVGINAPAANAVNFFNAAGNLYFELGDNPIILAMWVTIPHGYTMGQANSNIQIGWKDSANTFTTIPEFAGTGQLTNITSCSRQPFGPSGVYIQNPITGVSKHRLNLLGFNMQVSQVGAPAILNGVNIITSVTLEVLHTKQLTFAP